MQEIFDIIQNVHKEGMTILLVEQNAQMALSVADRAYVLETGRVVMEGTGAELLTNESACAAHIWAAELILKRGCIRWDTASFLLLSLYFRKRMCDN